MNWTGILDRDRNRAAWWLYLGLLGLGVAFLAYSFVGTFAFGLFVYYAARPVFGRIRSRIGRDGLAAAATLLGFVVPILLVVTYVVVAGMADLVSLAGEENFAEVVASALNVEQLTRGQQDLVSLVTDPPESVRSLPFGQAGSVLGGGLAVLAAAVGGLVHVSLAFAFAFYLLRDGDRIAAWFRGSVADRETAAHAYATAVDDDLETVFFGNVLFIAAVAILATAVYYGFNLVAPAALSIPFAILLALLTGVTSLIPLVVGKLVYVPVVAYVAATAVGSGGALLVYPAGLLVASFLFLDILPQTFLQPYITGREIHTGVLMFAYLLGPILFGWYGFFLLPIFVVLVLQAVRIVLTELLHGDRLTPDVDAAGSMGSAPSESSAADGGETDEPTGDEQTGDERSDGEGDEREA
ncbi:AI-2E family transporter [Halorussus amylolyticus]|uniref:AI-2E family transporter n=1 Tax=Halorussus amylolyticus TaxID=1126242 RepID=UPI00104620E2|nr:AI-2E family transporter [Halorussus amylolyticus]